MIGYFEWLLAGFLIQLPTFIIVGCLCVFGCCLWLGLMQIYQYFIWSDQSKTLFLQAALLFISAALVFGYLIYYLSVVL